MQSSITNHATFTTIALLLREKTYLKNPEMKCMILFTKYLSGMGEKRRNEKKNE